MNAHNEMEEVKAFTRKNLSQCATEILKWHKTGVLDEGFVRQAADMLKSYHDNDQLRLVQDIVHTHCLELSRRLGNSMKSIY